MENIEIKENKRYCPECGEELQKNELYICNFCRRELEKIRKEEEENNED